MILLLVEAVKIQEVPGHWHSRSRVGLRLQAQPAQEKTLDGLSQTRLQQGTSWWGQQGGRRGGHSAMVSLAGVSTLATRRGLR